MAVTPGRRPEANAGAAPHRKPKPPRRAANARDVVLNALGAVEKGATPAEALAAQGAAALEPRDQSFAHLLLLTVLRRRGQIDALLDTCLSHPLPRSAARIRDVLRLGVAQILFLDTAAHAAVDTAVDLANAEPGRFAPLVNAVLRRVLRERAAQGAFTADPAVNVPRWLWQSWCAQHGEDTARAIAVAHTQEPPLDLSLRDSSDAARWQAELNATLLPGGTLRLRDAGRVEALPGYAEGAWWVQDMAAALPARVLLAALAQQGRAGPATLVDLCAAPGGKTAQLAAAGHAVTAIDVAAERMDIVRANLARLHLPATCVVADGRTWQPDAPVDGVLLDAPCSATGTIRRHPDIAWAKTPAQVPALAALQAALLDNAARSLKPGGLLVYAVCSLQAEEGAQQVAAFLARHGAAFRALPIAVDELGGLPVVSAEGHLRSLPCHLADEGGMDGFFAARFQRV